MNNECFLEFITLIIDKGRRCDKDLTSQHKDLIIYHNYVRSGGINMPPKLTKLVKLESISYTCMKRVDYFHPHSNMQPKLYAKKFLFTEVHAHIAPYKCDLKINMTTIVILISVLRFCKLFK